MPDHGLGLFQTPAHFDCAIQYGLACLVLDDADFHLHNAQRPFRGGRRASHPKVLTEELALSYFHFAHAAAPFFLGNLGLPCLSRLLPFFSQSSQVSRNSR